MAYYSTEMAKGEHWIGYRIVGRYTVKDLVWTLPEGWIVRRAEQEGDAASAHVQILLGEATADQQERFRLLSEALGGLREEQRAALGIQRCGERDGELYWLTESTDSWSPLSGKIPAGPVDSKMVAKLGISLLPALEALQALGVIWLGLGPDQLLYLSDEAGVRLRIAPVSLAKDSFKTPLRPATRTGAELQRPVRGYLSPEEASKLPVDQPALTHMFGQLLFRLLTAKDPFPGATEDEVISALTAGRPALDLRAAAPEIPFELADLVSKMLAQEPRDRPALAQVADVLRAQAGLTRMLTDNGIPTSTVAGEEARRRFKGYIVERSVGAGAMGVVYKAHKIGDESGEVYAIKELKREFLAEEEWVKRFAVEGEERKDCHPGVVQGRGFHYNPGDLPYVIMEFVPGKTLAELIQIYPQEAQRLEETRAMRLARQIAEAMVYLHSKGLVHRDLKPDNIKVFEGDREERIKIVDLGIVKQLALPDRTRVGQVLGTDNYMAWELHERPPQPVDKDSDVCSLGFILFEMLTGQCYRLVKAADADPAKQALLESRYARPGLKRLITQMIDYDRRKRPNMEEVARRLREMLEGNGGIDEPPSPPGGQSSPPPPGGKQPVDPPIPPSRIPHRLIAAVGMLGVLALPAGAYLHGAQPVLLTTSPADAEVFMGKKRLCPSSPCQVEPGVRVQIRRGGYRQEEVVLPRSLSKELRMVLTPVRWRLRSVPDKAVLLLDKVPIGDTDLDAEPRHLLEDGDGRVSATPVRLTLSRHGYEPTTLDMDPTIDENRLVAMKEVTWKLQTDPPGASVYRAAQMLGKTPIEVVPARQLLPPLPASLVLSFRLPGYEDASSPTLSTTRSELIQDITLKPKSPPPPPPPPQKGPTHMTHGPASPPPLPSPQERLTVTYVRGELTAPNARQRLEECAAKRLVSGLCKGPAGCETKIAHQSDHQGHQLVFSLPDKPEGLADSLLAIKRCLEKTDLVQLFPPNLQVRFTWSAAPRLEGAKNQSNRKVSP